MGEKMALRSTNSEYGKIAQMLHWGVACLIFIMGTIGITLAIIEKSVVRTTLLNIHIGIGIVLSVFVIIRIIWKFNDNSPDPPEKLSSLHLLAFKLTHIFIYIVAVALITSGIVMAISLGFDILPFKPIVGIYIGKTAVFIFHILMFLFLMGLIAGHVGGVIIYQITKSDVLSRMGLTWFKKG